MTKLNTALVAIVKQEWTTSWKSFINDICSYGAGGQPQCENALNILKLLSEEVFDFSKNQLTKAQAEQLKSTFIEDFKTVYLLCKNVLDQSLVQGQEISGTLQRGCLKTLQAFMSWIPMGYIFETDLLDILVGNFIIPNATRQEAVRCFQEIANLNVEGEEKEPQYLEKIVLAYCNFIR